MREYLFHGKRVDNGEWVEGLPCYGGGLYPDGIETREGKIYGVIPETISQYTDMNEFVVTDGSYNQPLFEGDIVEVWSTRRPECMNPQSQYDGDVKVRAVIRFKHGQWSLDYDNEYNKAICRLRGNEQTERTIESWGEVYHFQCHSRDEEWEREHNGHYKWHDIVKIGTEFDNADLLEG